MWRGKNIVKRMANYVYKHKNTVPFNLILEYCKQRICIHIKYLNNITKQNSLKRKLESDEKVNKKNEENPNLVNSY